MEMSVREARAQFSTALAAAERGERVAITKHGRVVAELGPPSERKGVDWAALDRFGKERGWDKMEIEWPEEFDDPAFSRAVLGIGDDWDPSRR